MSDQGPRSTRAVDELAKQNRTYEARTGKTVKAKDGDMVVIDFLGKVDGAAFEGGAAEGAELVLGSGQFIPGFEEQLVGAKPDSDVEVKGDLPVDYQAENLKGKDAVFEVKVKEVKAPVDAPADDAFAEEARGGEPRKAPRAPEDQPRAAICRRHPLQAEARAAGPARHQARLPAAAEDGGGRVRLDLATGPAGQGSRQPSRRRTPRSPTRSCRKNIARSPSAGAPGPGPAEIGPRQQTSR